MATLNYFPSILWGSRTVRSTRYKCRIAANDVVVAAGNSITAAAYWAVPLGLQAQLTAAGATGLTIVNSGVGGARIQDLDVATQIAPSTPDVVWFEFGANDEFTGVTGANFQSVYEDKLDETLALTPVPQILGFNILCLGEQWTNTGGIPGWATNSYSAGILDKNDRLAEIFAARGLALVDQRARLLELEALINTPAPGVDTGKFCYDAVLGVHPGTQGNVYQGYWAMEHITVG